MTRRTIWYSIRGSLWFVPSIMAAAAILLALIMVRLDMWLEARELLPPVGALQSGPDGAREILSTIASSIITIAGVIFSVTIVTLSLAAGQYSPRVLRTFILDRLNQSVLGVLVAVFIYALLVLRAVHGGEQAFVPQLSLWLGIALAIVAVGFFIAFIHNTALSIQAPEIVARIARETLQGLRDARHTSHEDRSAQVQKQVSPEEIEAITWQEIPSREPGYVQDVNISGLFEIACKHRIVLEVQCPIGEFAITGRPLVKVGNCASLEEELIHKVQEQFGIDHYRTIDQDPAYGIHQLIDIALKALSTAINDSTTAIHCVDYLGVILHSALQEPTNPAVHREDGELRLLLKFNDRCDLIDMALNPMRRNALGNVPILTRLFGLLRQLAEDNEGPEVRKVLRKHVELLSENIERFVTSPADQQNCREAMERARAALGKHDSG